ncbi:MAG: DUF998 domain-containing protein [Verrucomicrobiales bacterium]
MRSLAACGVVAPVLDVLITIWLGALDPDYSHVRQYISELGESGRPYAAVFSVWSLLWGILFAGFALALGRGFGGQKGSWLGPGAVLIMAASGMVVGFFPCDPGGTAQTVSGEVHLIAGGWIGMSAMVLTPFLTWVGMRRRAAWRGYRTLTLAAGALLAIFAGWLVVCHDADAARSASAPGLAQRLFTGILYVWVVVVAIRLWSLGATAEPSAAALAR